MGSVLGSTSGKNEYGLIDCNFYEFLLTFNCFGDLKHIHVCTCILLRVLCDYVCLVRCRDSSSTCVLVLKFPLLSS